MGNGGIEILHHYEPTKTQLLAISKIGQKHIFTVPYSLFPVYRQYISLYIGEPRSIANYHLGWLENTKVFLYTVKNLTKELR